ncbi:OsmC family protein [Aeribacillus sp. FSL K6-2848]|uniref:OsmC family protein n=1 Tax=Aeribacillus sp. FSL K6-2848 TaxID=2954612 RepID=UPI0030FBD46B
MQIKATWQGGRAFEAVGPSGYKMAMDAMENYGGEGSAATPTEMLLAALAGCIGIDVTMILRHELDHIEAIDITVDGTRREELPSSFTAYTITFTVNGDITPKKVWRAIQLGKQKYCAVSASLKGDVTFKLILNGKEIPAEKE